MASANRATAQAARVGDSAFRWNLPPGFPEPRVPDDNPMTSGKVALGRRLFYDTRLSRDGTFSCATCHQQSRAFADDKGRGLGVTGERHPRGPMSLANVAYGPVLTWGNPTVRRLEAQALVPMFGEDPVELGLAGLEVQVLQRLRAEPTYPPLFRAAFPETGEPFTVAHVTQAIASFERTLLSGRAPYDRYRTTMDSSAISPAAHRGEDLFFSERLSCFRCHGGFNFSQAVDFVNNRVPSIEFHNNGLYNLDGGGAYPVPNTGVHAITHRADDMGRFKPPTLRNIALTAPYMHDGSLTTLEDVIAHYERGGQGGPLKSRFVKGFTLTADERRDLIGFLESLTDTAFTTDPALGDPWQRAATERTPPLARAQPARDGTRRIDFDSALRGLALDPLATDVDALPGAPGTSIRDADEMALIAAILEQPSLDLHTNGGITHRAVVDAFREARSEAIDDLRILSAAYPTAADVVAGYALLGRRTFGAFATRSTEFGPRLKGDYAPAFALERFLAFDGDADGDGVSNLAEYRATSDRGRAAYIAAALDPTVRWPTDPAPK